MSNEQFDKKHRRDEGPRLTEQERRDVRMMVLRGLPRPFAVAVVKKVFKGPYG